MSIVGADFWIEAFCPLSLDQEIVLLTSSKAGFSYQAGVVCASENGTKPQSSPLLGFVDAVIPVTCSESSFGIFPSQKGRGTDRDRSKVHIETPL